MITILYQGPKINGMLYHLQLLPLPVYLPLKESFLIFSIINQNIQNQIQQIKITEEQFLSFNINDLFYLIHVSTRGPPRISPIRFLEVSSPLTLVTYSSYSVLKYSIIILSIL